MAYNCSAEHHRWDTQDRCDVSHRSDHTARTNANGAIDDLSTWYNCSHQPCPNRESANADVVGSDPPTLDPRYQYPTIFDRPQIVMTHMQNQIGQLTLAVTQLVQHQAAAPAGQAAQPQNITVTNRDSIAKPVTYSGERGPEAMRYIGQVQLYCNMAGIRATYERISVALSYLRGDALVWATPYIIEAATSNAFTSFPGWNQFTEAFYAHFTFANDKEAATQALNDLTEEDHPERNTRALSKYDADFSNLARRTGLSDVDLRFRYKKGLPQRIRVALIHVPDNAIDMQPKLAAESLRLDQKIDEVKPRRSGKTASALPRLSAPPTSRSISTYTPPRTTSTPSASNLPDPNAMQIDSNKMTRERMQREGRCFNCGEKGHRGHECVQPRRNKPFWLQGTQTETPGAGSSTGPGTQAYHAPVQVAATQQNTPQPPPDWMQQMQTMSAAVAAMKYELDELRKLKEDPEGF